MAGFDFPLRFPTSGKDSPENAERKVSALSNALGKLGLSAESVKSTFAGVFGANIVQQGLSKIISGVGGAIDSFTEFQTAVAEINTLLDDQTKITKETEKAFIDFSSQFGGSTASQAKAFYQIVSAGTTDAADATKLLNVANKAAIAGITSVETAINGLTTTLAVYQSETVDATRASDILFSIVKLGKTEFAPLSRSIGTVAGVAKGAGVTLEELAATLAVFTKTSGGTEKAVTGLRSVINAIIKPSQEAATEARKLGLEFSAAGIKAAGGFIPFLEQLIQKTNGSTDELSKLFTSSEALAGISSVVSVGVDELGKSLDVVRNSAGSTEKAFTIVSQTLQFQINALTASFRNLAQQSIASLEPLILPILNISKALVDNFDRALKLVIISVLLFNRSLISTQISTFVSGIRAAGTSIISFSGIMRAATIAINVFKAAATLGLAFAIETIITKFTELSDEVGGFANGFKVIALRARIAFQNFRKILIENVTVPFLELKALIPGIIGDEAKSELSKIPDVLLDVDKAIFKAVIELDKLRAKNIEVGASSKNAAAGLNSQADGANKAAAAISSLATAGRLLSEGQNPFQAQEQLDRSDLEQQLSAELITREEFLNASFDQEIAAFERQQDALNQALIERQITQDAFDAAALTAKQSLDTKIDALNKKSIQDERTRNQERLRERQKFFSDASSLASSKSKELAAIGKAAAVAQIAINTPESISNAFNFGTRFGGPVLGFVFGAIAAAAQANLAAQAAGLQTGLTSVPSGFNENRPGGGFPALLSTGERVVNTEQNKDLRTFIESERGTKGIIMQLVDEIRSIGNRPILIEVDGREIFRTVDDQLVAGRAFSTA